MQMKTSKAEDIVCTWLTQANIAYVRNNWQLIKSPSGHKMEVDIYIPSLKLGIECDGGAYHEEGNYPYWKWQLMTRGSDPPSKKWKGYHKYKDDECAKKGIKLIHVCSEDVTDLPDQTKSYIFSEIQSQCNLLEGK